MKLLMDLGIEVSVGFNLDSDSLHPRPRHLRA